MRAKTIYFMKFDDKGHETLHGSLGLAKPREFETYDSLADFIKTTDGGIHAPGTGRTGAYWIVDKSTRDRLAVLIKG